LFLFHWICPFNYYNGTFDQRDFVSFIGTFYILIQNSLLLYK